MENRERNDLQRYINLFDLAVSPKYLTEIFIWNRRIQIKNYQGSLINILVWWIILVWHTEKDNKEQQDVGKVSIIGKYMIRTWKFVLQPSEYYFLTSKLWISLMIKRDDASVHSVYIESN